MRASIIALLLVLFVGFAGAAAWTPTYNMGSDSGATFPGPINAYGFGATYTPTDAGASVLNGWGQIAVQTIAAAETTDTDQIKIAHVNEFNATTNFRMDSTGAYNGYFVAQPDVPRNIIVTMNTSTSGDVKLTGTDIADAVITENLTWTAETGAKSSLRAFKTITRVDGHISTSTAQAIIGTGNVLGLNILSATNPVLYCALGGTREGTAPTVTVSSTVLSLNTIDTSSAPGGAVTKVWMVQS